MIETARLRLDRWNDRHRDAFAAMHADPEVMADQGGPICQLQSDEKFERYLAAQRDYGVSRWAVESPDGAFLGYAGVMPRMLQDHPLGTHYEVGWRFARAAWGRGYATESARAALRHAIDHLGGEEILSYTSPENERSQSVMTKLALRRDRARDFSAMGPRGLQFRWLVWVVPLEVTYSDH